jgi:hypothetical protein
MKDDIKRELLADILNTQTDEECGQMFSDSRLHQVLMGTSPLTEEEKKRLWLSPTARAQYFEAREQICQDIRRRWAELNVTLRAERRVAADESSPVIVPSEDFTVRIYREEDVDMPWSISLTLEPRIRDTIGPEVQVRLVDSGGLEWLRGHPSKRGEINSGWFNLEISPVDRLLQHELRLDVV